MANRSPPQTGEVHEKNAPDHRHDGLRLHQQYRRCFCRCQSRQQPFVRDPVRSQQLGLTRRGHKDYHGRRPPPDRWGMDARPFCPTDGWLCRRQPGKLGRTGALWHLSAQLRLGGADGRWHHVCRRRRLQRRQIRRKWHRLATSLGDLHNSGGNRLLHVHHVGRWGILGGQYPPCSRCSGTGDLRDDARRLQPHRCRICMAPAKATTLTTPRGGKQKAPSGAFLIHMINLYQVATDVLSE